MVALRIVDASDPASVLYELDPSDREDAQNVYMCKTKQKACKQPDKRRKRYKSKKIPKSSFVTPNTLREELSTRSVDNIEYNKQSKRTESINSIRTIIHNSAPKRGKGKRRSHDRRRKHETIFSG